jgi:hypothetical protein
MSMEAKDLKMNMLVEMPKKPEWGPGRVLEIKGTRVQIFFPDVPIHAREAARTTTLPSE